MKKTTRKKQEIWTFSFSFEHHGKFSAFHRLADYLPEEIRKVRVTFPWARFMPKVFRNRIRALYLNIAEKRLIRQASKDQPRLIHFFYPENCLFSNCLKKQYHGKILFTLHQPASFLPTFRTSLQGRAFIANARRADRLISLSPSENKNYVEFFKNREVRCVPHGVDTDFFRPESQINQKPLVLTIGNWMRDFTTWCKVVELFEYENRPVQFLLVTNRTNVERFQLKERANASIKSDLSDERIRRMYSEASCVFLPLLDAVANNSLLEGLAMGKRILVTDLPSTRYYGSDFVKLLKKSNDFQAAALSLKTLLNTDKIINNDHKIRSWACKQFSWHKIAQKYLEEYTGLLSSPKKT